MELNPVFVNELRQTFFHRKPQSALKFWLAINGILLWVTQYAVELPEVTANLVATAIPLFVPALCAGAFAREYEQQTWQDLYLTRLTNRQVLVGKLSAYLLVAVGGTLSLAPALCVANAVMAAGKQTPDFDLALMAGFLTEFFVQRIAVLTFLAALIVALSLVCSRYCATRRAALVSSYVAVFLLTVLLYWIPIVMYPSARVPTYSLTWMEAYLTHGSQFDLISVYLAFSSTLFSGCVLLLWVSLSEQRGYRGDPDGSRRGWQPAVPARLRS